MLTELLAGGAAGALVAHHLCKARISRLEQRVTALECAAARAEPETLEPTSPGIAEAVLRKRAARSAHRAPTTPAAAALHAFSDAFVPPPACPVQAPKPPSALHTAAQSIAGLVMANPFASLGVLLVLVSVGFLFSLLAAANVLPPALRVGLVAAAGLAVLAIGLHQQPRRAALGLNLQGGALAVQYLCALWAYQGYGLVGSTTAFAWMAGLSTLAMAWSTWRRQALFAFMALAGALLTPIAASSGSGEFSGLALYCAWVSALALAAGLHLRMPSLASAALAGVSALLGAALDLPAGASALSVTCLVATLAGMQACALWWTRDCFDWQRRQIAAVVSVLVGAPLVLTGLLGAKDAVGDVTAAAIIGACALPQLLWVLRAPPRWRGWLLFVGAGLGITALGVGFEGASRAMAFSVCAMGLVVLATTVQRPWAGSAAFVYWALSVVLGAEPLDQGQAMPLVISGFVALAAGFLSRATPLGTAYTALAPLVLWAPVAHGRKALDPQVIGFFVHWALLACLAGRWLAKRGVAWGALKLSALWLLPAGAALLLAPAHLTQGSPLALREAVLACMLLLSYQAVEDAVGEPALWRYVPYPGKAAGLTLLMPAAVSLELFRLLPALGASDALATGTVALLWALWTHVALSAGRLWPGNFHASVSAGAAAPLAVSVFALRTPDAGLVAACASVPLLWLAALRDPARRRHHSQRWALALAGIAGLCLLLHAIASAYGLRSSAAALVFKARMQPWVSLLWAAGAMAVVLYGGRERSRKVWMAGGAAILVLALKMLLVDLATLSLAAKVGVFLATGVALIVLGRFSPAPPSATKASLP